MRKRVHEFIYGSGLAAIASVCVYAAAWGCDALLRAEYVQPVGIAAMMVVGAGVLMLGVWAYECDATDDRRG